MVVGGGEGGCGYGGGGFCGWCAGGGGSLLGLRGCCKCAGAGVDVGGFGIWLVWLFWAWG